MTIETGSSGPANGSASLLGITSELLDMLVCPVDHGALTVAAGSLTCSICGRTYSVENGIPNMVVDARVEGER